MASFATLRGTEYRIDRGDGSSRSGLDRTRLSPYQFSTFGIPVDVPNEPSTVPALFHPIYGKHAISSKTRSTDPSPHASEPTSPHGDKISTEKADGRCRCWRRETGSTRACRFVESLR